MLSGDFDETDVRQFEDSRRKTFRRGSTNAFLLAVPRYMCIQYIHVNRSTSSQFDLTFPDYT